MLLRLCQLKSLAILVLIVSGCSRFQATSEPSLDLLSVLESKWFSAIPEHALQDQQGKAQTHLFFDAKPELSTSGLYTNIVVLTPEDSRNSYALDLNSGQRYFEHSYCKQTDIWKLYSGSVFRPRFTVGTIPRMLDQLGGPQKVIVFGGAEKFAAYPDLQSHRVRLVSAYVEQNCVMGNCLGKSNWVSRLVLVAVDPDDKKLEHIKTPQDLHSTFDWIEMKATLENMDGHNGQAGALYPAVRLGQLLPIEEAMNYYKKRSIYLNEQETDKIRKSCVALYDRLYDEVGRERAEDKPAQTMTELNTKIKLREELKKKKTPVGFAKRLASFSKKYSQEVASCERFIYHGNVNRDPEKFWFLSYMGIFYRLHKDGYYFDCHRKSWQKNTLDNQGRPIYDLKIGLDNCTERDLDLAMSYLPNFLTGLKGSESYFYKFIDYDTHSFGTHRKLYSWVKVRARKFNCSNELNESVRKETKVFPDDVSWKNRDVKDIEDEMKIIY